MHTHAHTHTHTHTHTHIYIYIYIYSLRKTTNRWYRIINSFLSCYYKFISILLHWGLYQENLNIHSWIISCPDGITPNSGLTEPKNTLSLSLSLSLSIYIYIYIYILFYCIPFVLRAIAMRNDYSGLINFEVKNFFIRDFLYRNLQLHV